METWICSKFAWDSKLNVNSPKNYFQLVDDEKVPRGFWKIAIVTGVLPSTDSEVKGELNGLLKRPVNKLFPIEYTYHDTNQTDKAREQKLRWEATVIDELKRKYES